MRSARRRTTLRLFAGSALICLAPVLLLGLALGASYRREAQRRGVAEGRSEAELIAQTAIEPWLTNRPLHGRLLAAPDSPYATLERMTRQAIGAGHIVRLRVRDLTGAVVFSDDGSGFDAHSDDDEAIDAAHGAVIADLTRLNSDKNDSGRLGPQVIEVYEPLVAGTPPQTVGVLEVYLPYAPIHNEVAASLHTLLLNLAIGLSALYVVLFVISWFVSRGLRREAAANAFAAEHDALTGLPNRDLFLRNITRVLRTGRVVAIAIIDLDRFANINDSLGHHNGDAVLIEVARRVEAALGPHDVLARLGGDEFGVVLGDARDLASTWTRLQEVVTDEIDISGLPVMVEASIGYALAPEDGDRADELLQHADIALRAAKKLSIVTRYDAAHDTYDPSNLALMAELRHAIDADQLVLHYQPKARFSSGEFESIEALVRWQHPTRGLLTPDRFVTLAEPTELIERLTDWVLRRALTDVRDLHSTRELSVAVNVSARSLGRADFPDRVVQILEETGVDASRLTIEITETALVTDPARAAITLARLDHLGVMISLDDFGTGQTSLGYLRSLPIDELKIDKSFVCDLVDNPSHKAIVRSIIDLGHNLGLSVVAEGIETEPVFHALLDARCDTAQGFFLARPMPAGDLPRFLATARPIASDAQSRNHEIASPRS